MFFTFYIEKLFYVYYLPSHYCCTPENTSGHFQSSLRSGFLTHNIIESIQVYSLWSTWPTAWNSTHCIQKAAKLISFTLRPNKSFPRPKQNVNSTLLRFCILVYSQTSGPEKWCLEVLKPQHGVNTDLWHQAEWTGIQVFSQVTVKGV